MNKLGGFIVDLLQVVVFSLSIFLFIYLLVLQPHKIKGASMLPNFEDGEYLLTDKVTYRLSTPQRGDVIVFKAPPKYEDEFIKRILGVPGDMVAIKEKEVFINGIKLEEQYIPDDFATFPGKIFTEGKTVEVPQGSYFVLGDNREHSLDSRNFGFVPREKISGRAWIIYWPPNRAGSIKEPTYFF